ncbi:MAG: NAD(P)H-binding protein [Pseudobdellovibrionaceae bacterium]
MKVIIFGATGMVGRGVLRECLNDPTVESVLSVGRSSIKTQHRKLLEIVHKDMEYYTDIASGLTGYDACFFCLGTPSPGKTEEQYSKITYDITLAAATSIYRLNPKITFIYVSAAGADSTEKGRVMWARVRGKTENALFDLPFKAVYIFRPGIIQPLHGVRSKTKAYRRFYKITKPILPVVRWFFPNLVSTTEIIGQAMINVARYGAPHKILTNKDFEKLAKANSK